MKFVIEYNPEPAEMRKAILKTYRTAVRTKYTLLADAEIAEGLPAIERRMAEVEANGGELDIELANVFVAHGPEALEAAPEDDKS
jgi:hypothetical protein